VVIFLPKRIALSFCRLDSGQRNLSKSHVSRDYPRVKTAFLLEAINIPKWFLFFLKQNYSRHVKKYIKFKMLIEFKKKFPKMEKLSMEKIGFFLGKIPH
jgi:hypothetical protein